MNYVIVFLWLVGFVCGLIGFDGAVTVMMLSWAYPAGAACAAAIAEIRHARRERNLMRDCR